MTKDNKRQIIKRKRILTKISLIIIEIILSPILLLAFLGYIFTEKWQSFKDGMYQKIEDYRIDVVYLEKYGQTYKEYYAEDSVS